MCLFHDINNVARSRNISTTIIFTPVTTLQGSHGDWKTGKTGKMKMVREKSGKSQGASKNDQKSGNFVKSQGTLPDVSKITDTQIMRYKPLNMCSP